MSKTEYKSTNQLMRHLRDNGIDISENCKNSS